ncbi:putative translation initiation factor IF-2 isoform X1 [Iris pallida]|uniref:Translation initiation factor IF-2 isoform X1 n=1 Tax=Iris pallida TaxID=29817 RepID=A0AAX6F1N5_IRIPA|nr:putative translation initiation factor IF-2 isoform X1 [Iris pallida]
MTTTTTSTPAKPTAGCGGDGCLARDSCPLHFVRHRGVLCRLCTSCVLKYHPGSFCCLCFSVLDPSAVPPPSQPQPLVHCSKCTSVSHLSCLPSPDLSSRFVCPCCQHPDGFTFFERRQQIDLASARPLLAAARLAAGSMRLAAAAARAEAERKAKEAVVARKRAREMVERAIVVAISEREREREKEKEMRESLAVMVAEQPKKKQQLAATTVVPLSAAGEATPTPTPARKNWRGHHHREVEKWMRFHEMGAQVDDEMKSSNKVRNVKEEEKGKKGTGSGSQVKKIEAGGSEKGPKLPPSIQDASSSGTNSRVILTGSTTTASLHS